MKRSTMAGIAVVSGLALAAGSQVGGGKGPNELPRSVASIERSGEACPAFGLTSIDPEHERYAGHVVLRVPDCNGKPGDVELVGPGGKLDGTAENGQSLAISCITTGGELAVFAVLQGGGNVEVFGGHLPYVALGPTAQAQVHQDRVLAKHSGNHVPDC